MENRRPAAVAAAGTRGRRLRWLLLAAGILVIVLVLVSTARLFAPGSADPWRDHGRQTVGQSAPVVQEAPEAIAPAPAPAVIIDAPATGAIALPADNPLAQIQPQPGTAAPLATDASAAAGAARAAPAAAANTRRSTAATPARASTPAPADASGGLLSTLLGIIRQDTPEPASHESMDALVAHILAENERTHADTSAALAALGQPRTAETEAPAPTRAQRELQACPAANTVQGIHCRDRVCARWAGRDPACPAR